MAATEPATSEAAAYLREVTAQLWPGGYEFEPVARLKRRHGAPDADTFVVVPSMRNPKLLVPSRPRTAAAAAIGNFKAASSRRERAVMSALTVAARAGAFDLLPDRVRVAANRSQAEAIDAHLGAVLGRPVTVSLYVSRARAVRKPLLQVIDPRSGTFGYAKIGISTFTRRLVRAEADAVRLFGGQQWQVLRVADVLYSGTWRGHEVLVQSALGRGSTPQLEQPELHRAMREVCGVRGMSTAELRGSSYWSALRDRIAARPDSPHRALLRRLYDALDAAIGGTQVQFGASHGDWAPWNLTALDNRILAWDWEKFEADVPAGLDAVHFRVQGAVVLGRQTPADAFANALDTAGMFLRELVPDPSLRRPTVLLYALHIVTRYLEDGELSAGAGRMSRLNTWLPGIVAAAELRSQGTSET